MVFNLDKRVSIFAVCLTALTIMVSIKLSSYILPSAFYFSISSVFKTNEGMMLVNAPGVSAERFCELIRKNRIHPNDLGYFFEDCEGARDAENSTRKGWGATAKQFERDAIYAAWYTNHDNFANAFDAALKEPSAQGQLYVSLFDASINDGPYNSVLSDFEREVYYSVYGDINRNINEYATKTLKPVISKLVSRAAKTLDGNQKEFDPLQLTLTDEQRAKFKVDFPQFITDKIANTPAKQLFPPPKIEVIDNTISSTFSVENLGYNIGSAYGDMLSELIDTWIAEFYKLHDINDDLITANIEQAKSDFFWDNLPSYIISAIIRFAVVFFAVLLVSSLLLGRFDVTTFAIGAAFAALLLTWPIINQWHLVVEDDWQDMKYKFLFVYFIYGVAFYFTGKSAAISSLIVKRKMSQADFVDAHHDIDEKVFGGINISASEFAKNFALAISLNSIAFMFNLIVPTSG